METTSPAAGAAKGRSSTPLTIALGVGVLAVGTIFALTSGWYNDWYSVFKAVHVVVAVFWVGGGLTITLLGLRAERMDDPREIATLARQAAFVGEKFFAPAGLIVLLMGIAMVVNADLGWDHFWVIAALVGYAMTFMTGIGVLSPLAKKIDELIESKGVEAARDAGRDQADPLDRAVDVAVLVLVVADMTTKPFS